MLQRVFWIAGLGIFLGASAAPAQTLVARYQFDNPVTLGMDSSAFGNDAVNTAVTPGTDRFGNPMRAGSFNGITSVLTKSGGLNGYDGLPGFTFAAWVNRSSADAAFSGIVSQDPAGAACCTNRFLLNGADTPYVDAGAHADFSFAAPVIPNDAWVHLIMTADDTGPGNDVDIYLNGAFAGTHHFGHDLANSSLFDTFIGSGENGNAHFFQGLLDDVQIYDGSISADQAALLFASGLATPEPTSVAVWSVMGAVVAFGLILRRRRTNVC